MEKELEESLTFFRKELHQFPELSQEEWKTQERILTFLNGQGIEAAKIGKTGVLVVFEGASEGKTLMLRSDHDALPIQEINSFTHKSTIDGVSHKCGHDGHTAIMCGVAMHFKSKPIKSGRLLLVFQPAEENGEGAKAVLEDVSFTFKPDRVYALHNLPGYEMHKIVCRNDSFTAAAKSIVIKLEGKTSHAAEPEKGLNPATAVSKLIEMFKRIDVTDLEDSSFFLTTPVHISLGETSYGISAGHAEVHYTFRSWSNQVMDDNCQLIIQKVNEIAKEERLSVGISWTQEFDANQNDPDAVSVIRGATEKNELVFEERKTPFKWGEDFGLFTKKYSGAMFGIGSGLECPALHNPDYDFPDEIIRTGVKMFTTISDDFLNEPSP